MWRNIILVMAAALLALVVVLVVRTLFFVSPGLPVSTVDLPAVPVESVDHLSEAVKIETVSPSTSPEEQRRQFQKFQNLLKRAYPAVHSQVSNEIINDYSLLYTWPGSRSDINPALILAHQDVVPVEPGTEHHWQQPPFSGHVDSDYIWGRGTWDNKGNLMAMMAALELLLESGFQPERTLVLAFGHDEETGGQEGAMALARLLKERGQRFEFILDEGPTIARSFFPGVNQPVAMIAIAEKGYLTLSLTTKSAGGHSSVPASITAIGRLAKAVNRLEEQQLPTDLSGPAQRMLEAIGPAMPFSKRLVLANLWLFEPLILQSMAKQSFTNAYIRTTIAPTMMSAGVKENVLPQSAQAIVNFRLLPGQSIAQVIAWVTAIIDDDQVAVARHGPASSEPSKISSLDSLGYQELKRAIHQVFPDATAVPALLFAATDSRHYAELSGQIFRFTPITIEPDDLKRIHGTNERIAIKDYQNAVRFYYQLIKNTVVVKQP